MVLNASIRLVEYDAIKIVPLDFEIGDEEIDAYIFTSQNAVKAFLAHSYESNKKVETVISFCVGEKTKELAASFSDETLVEQSAEELAEVITKYHKSKSFLFISGKQRLDTLPKILTENNIRHKEVHVYETLLTPKKIDRTFDGIMFFSPSGVNSHFQKNTPDTNSLAFCIGPTTEKAVKKHISKTILANKPSIENVLVQAIKQFRLYD